MNPESIVIIRASWALLAPDADTISRTLFAQLFANDPAVAALFARHDFDAHVIAFASALDTIVDALDDPDALVAITGALGRRHATYKIDERHFEVFREALIETLGRALGARFTPQWRTAWMEACTLIISLMLRAMRREIAISTTQHTHP